MKVRVAAPDAESAGSLAERLVGVIDEAEVRRDGTWAEINVRAGAQGDRIIGRALRAIDTWLDESGVESVTVHLDDRSHVMARGGALPQPAAS